MTKWMALLLLVFSTQISVAVAAPACKTLVNSLIKTPYMSEITVVIGTDRKGSKSAVIANEIVRQLQQQENVRVNLIDLAKLPKSIFKSDYFDKKPAAFQSGFVDPIVRSNGVVFVIPEYDGAVPGILSYYLNHMRSSFDQKQIALVGLSAGKWGARSALDTFKGTLTHRRGRILGDLQINVENVENKVAEDKITDNDTVQRIATTAKELTKSIGKSEESVNSQRSLAQLALALKEKNVAIKLNNEISIEGKLGNVLLNENQTPAYIQMSGPTRIKLKDTVIQGQDIDVHNTGYGMPVGAVKKLHRQWYKKANLISAQLTIGKKTKMEFESGIVVDGTIKNLTFDGNGDLLVITFSDVYVKNGKQILFDKNWGDFDMAVGDHIEQVNAGAN